MVFTLILGEYLVNDSYNMLWEAMSILSQFLPYGVLILINLSLFLYFKKNGNLLAGLFIGETILSFILSILNPNFNTWYFKGIFGLADPVSIIKNHSLLTNHFGLIILTMILSVSLLILIHLSSRFTFLNSERDQGNKSTN